MSMHSELRLPKHQRLVCKLIHSLLERNLVASQCRRLGIQMHCNRQQEAKGERDAHQDPWLIEDQALGSDDADQRSPNRENSLA